MVQLLRCNFCLKEYKTSLGVDSNLVRHMRTSHREEFRDYKGRKRPSYEAPENGQKFTQEEINEDILSFLIETCQPLSVVEHPAFKRLIHKLSNGDYNSVRYGHQQFFLSLTFYFKEPNNECPCSLTFLRI